MAKSKKKKNGSSLSFDSSVSDLMSCLVFVFIITIVALAVNLQKQIKDSEEAMSEYSDSIKARNELMLKIQEDLRKLKINVFVDDENGVISFPESTVFASGEANVSAKGVSVFQQVGNSLNTYLNCNSDKKIKYLCNDNSELRVDSIVVEGHADPSPLRGRAKIEHGTNMNLSLKRSLNTYSLIIEKFNNEKFLNRKGEGILGAAGFGAQKPPSRLASDVYNTLIPGNSLLASKIVDKYNSMKSVKHGEKLSYLEQYMKQDLNVENLEKKLRYLTYKSYRRIDLRFIMSLPKILEEKDGEISSKDSI